MRIRSVDKSLFRQLHFSYGQQSHHSAICKLLGERGLHELVVQMPSIHKSHHAEYIYASPVSMGRSLLYIASLRAITLLSHK